MSKVCKVPENNKIHQQQPSRFVCSCTSQHRIMNFMALKKSESREINDIKLKSRWLYCKFCDFFFFSRCHSRSQRWWESSLAPKQRLLLHNFPFHSAFEVHWLSSPRFFPSFSAVHYATVPTFALQSKEKQWKKSSKFARNGGKLKIRKFLWKLKSSDGNDMSTKSTLISHD